MCYQFRIKPIVLIAAHERGKDITLETAFDGMSIPLHHGAQRYFEEKGFPAS
ncbi:TAXI family TRAP transporter solute-binding subunit [Chloroflexota bacterium]